MSLTDSVSFKKAPAKDSADSSGSDCFKTKDVADALAFREEEVAKNYESLIKCRYNPRTDPPGTLREYITLDLRDVRNRFDKVIQKPLYPVITPKHPDFIDYETRLKSFGDWPAQCPVRPISLAAAGLFASGYAEGIYDCVKCFYCGCGFCFWDKGDDPMREHKRYSTLCPFIRSLKH